MDSAKLRSLYERVKPKVDFSSIRFHKDQGDSIAVNSGVLLPAEILRDSGAMVQVYHKGGTGYCATSDLSERGLKSAFDKAQDWAESNAGQCVADYEKLEMPHPKGSFRSPVEIMWDDVALKDKILFLNQACEAATINDKIVDVVVTAWHNRSERLYLTSKGGEVYQDFDRIFPTLKVTANDANQTQWRTNGGWANVRQQGWEYMQESLSIDSAKQIGEEALQLLSAPNCPTEKLDLILAPDQMVLQIHESIGHPLELDRILGDERNYAGTSFVTQDMVGSYQYGSELLNVTFDPTIAKQTSSYAFDDDGLEAKREFIIRKGKLERLLGGGVSQFRAGLQGTANSRADSWRRPAMDRMANLNLEPGDSKFEDMVSSIERGVLMRTNTSWSIDDSRNKFQFGCEWGQMIENGKLTDVVRNPNYRGISANFWRGLTKVGDQDSFEVLGTPNCGKGEPNQAVFVGHATPPCLFSDVEVFGGE